MIVDNNNSLRKKINEQRIKLSPEMREVSAQKIKTALCGIKIFQEGKNYGIYLPFRGEVDTKPIIEYLSANNKNCYLPIVKENIEEPMSFALYKEGAKLHKNKYAIFEPLLNESILLSSRDLDVVITPLVAFDDYGNRVGSGKGYYDRTFAFKKEISAEMKPHLVGIAYEFQKTTNLKPAVWDVPLEIIVTEETIYYFQTKPE